MVFYRTLYRSKDYLVKQNWLYRWLAQPDGTIHSRINRWAHHRPSLEYMQPMVQLCNQPSGDYLMLGLGGGALSHTLHHKLSHPSFDVVEINPEIISIAKQYFYIDTIPELTIIKADAEQYINQCDKQYNGILIDLYQDTTYPKHCATDSFFKACQARLKPNSLITINCANMSQYAMLIKQLHSVFGKSVLTIRIAHPRNVILVASNQPLHSLIDKIPLKNLGWHVETGAVGFLRK